MIRCIVHTRSSETDRNGNRYHLAEFWNVAKGRGVSVRMEVGGESNARHLAYQIFKDYEAILSIDSEISKSDYRRLRAWGTVQHEGKEGREALADLFSRDGWDSSYFVEGSNA